MNKHNIFGVLIILLSLASLPFAAHSQTYGRQKAKDLQIHTSENCVQEGLNLAFCGCQAMRLNSPEFLMFSETIKSDKDLPKMEAYFIQNVVTTCLLDRKVSQQACIQGMKKETTEYSDQVINDYCECMAEEIDENVNRNALKGMDKYQIQAELTVLGEKAHPVCDKVRVK